MRSSAGTTHDFIRFGSAREDEFACAKWIIAAAFAAFSIGTAAAQMNATSDGPATQAYMKAMQAMDNKMKSMTPSGDPSKDFVMMMAPHHEAAVDMAEAYLKYGKHPELVRMARNIITSQKAEIEEMNAWQAKHGM